VRLDPDAPASRASSKQQHDSRKEPGRFRIHCPSAARTCTYGALPVAMEPTNLSAQLVQPCSDWLAEPLTKGEEQKQEKGEEPEPEWAGVAPKKKKKKKEGEIPEWVHWGETVTKHWGETVTKKKKKKEGEEPELGWEGETTKVKKKKKKAKAEEVEEKEEGAESAKPRKKKKQYSATLSAGQSSLLSSSLNSDVLTASLSDESGPSWDSQINAICTDDAEVSSPIVLGASPVLLQAPSTTTTYGDISAQSRLSLTGQALSSPLPTHPAAPASPNVAVPLRNPPEVAAPSHRSASVVVPSTQNESRALSPVEIASPPPTDFDFSTLSSVARDAPRREWSPPPNVSPTFGRRDIGKFKIRVG
jgi:hypothetical protein